MCCKTNGMKLKKLKFIFRLHDTAVHQDTHHLESAKRWYNCALLFEFHSIRVRCATILSTTVMLYLFIYIYNVLNCLFYLFESIKVPYRINWKIYGVICDIMIDDVSNADGLHVEVVVHAYIFSSMRPRDGVVVYSIDRNIIAHCARSSVPTTPSRPGRCFIPSFGCRQSSGLLISLSFY